MTDITELITGLLHGARELQNKITYSGLYERTSISLREFI